MLAHNVIPIVAAVAAELAVGMVWYSDYAFGPMWRKAGGKSDMKDLYEKLAMHAVAGLITASALLIAMDAFQKANIDVYTKEGLGRIFSMFFEDKATPRTVMTAVKTAGFIWLGFIVPVKAFYVIWESGNWRKFVITALGNGAGLVTMAVVLAKLA